ncbi:solute carrier family 52 (riboflavin transporter), member 1 L homeolog isoform X1 [Xenopus laevis]|nr:solute carrier family 52 (riboflavin transporter), member 1 L homeolog [Xenopus laevis]XP_018122124.1 solute carrier family 52 (riboflavin transporter), member 1 L homeolog isoform X1 [Xenopus laevis]XP_018122125.1 solute carrier family 52 (riboflavin transporter), member 1 L homeolog isoform X1 [Xenopus laevis]AAH84398.1 LOC495180 protein [Xenopus laevis]
MALNPRDLLMHLLVALFGMGSWVSVNSLWVELPVVVKELPEGWNLPAFLTVIIALGNVGPLAVTLSHRFCPPGRVSEPWLIRSVQGLSLVSAGFLAGFWDRRVLVAGEERSVPYLVLGYLLALGCCTSNVTFLPFMYSFPQQFVRSFFIGQGLSALLPCVLALAQGVGRLECHNNTWGNHSEPHYLQENFPVSSYFWGLFCFLGVSALAFFLLLILRERNKEEEQGEGPSQQRDGGSEDSYPLKSPEQEQPQEPPNGNNGEQSFWTARNVYLLVLLGLSNALTNGILPSVQTYSCLPYGPDAYHLSVILSNIANPAACFIAMCLLCRSSVILGVIMAVGMIFGGYLMVLAALSPCPPLVGSLAGVVLVILSWTLFLGLLSYLKVVIGSLLHEAGHSALLWCGAVIQIGSLVGALVMFPMVSIYHLFQSGRDCQDNCPL